MLWRVGTANATILPAHAAITAEGNRRSLSRCLVAELDQRWISHQTCFKGPALLRSRARSLGSRIRPVRTSD